MTRGRTRQGSIARWLVTLLVSGAVLTVTATSLQAYSGSRGEDRSFQGAPQALTDSSGGVAMFDGPPMTPGESRTGCMVVRNQSGSPARVVLFGRTGGTGLDAHLELKVVRGTGPCDDFRRDASSGALYRGTVQGFPDDARSGLVDPAGTWEPGESHTYRFVVRLSDDAPQGLTASQSFVWQTSA